MDRETHIQIDRIEQKIDYLIEEYEKLLEDEEEDQEEKDEEKELESEKRLIDKGIIIKKTIKNKESELKE